MYWCIRIYTRRARLFGFVGRTRCARSTFIAPSPVEIPAYVYDFKQSRASQMNYSYAIRSRRGVRCRHAPGRTWVRKLNLLHLNDSEELPCTCIRASKNGYGFLVVFFSPPQNDWTYVNERAKCWGGKKKSLRGDVGAAWTRVSDVTLSRFLNPFSANTFPVTKCIPKTIFPCVPCRRRIHSADRPRRVWPRKDNFGDVRKRFFFFF